MKKYVVVMKALKDTDSNPKLFERLEFYKMAKCSIVVNDKLGHFMGSIDFTNLEKVFTNPLFSKNALVEILEETTHRREDNEKSYISFIAITLNTEEETEKEAE